MVRSGRELRVELARLLNERELLNLEVNRLRARMLQLERSVRRLHRSSRYYTPPPWSAAPPSNVLQLKREE